ncbi:MAG: prepilin-type N-terminal cleavage/methylation domain-containing protein [Verrucomicrobia bacterium]|nr:prepilin-type N-terminal cleavage/methylation domain-containing protein [Verrucomicrobiota bacterium]
MKLYTLSEQKSSRSGFTLMELLVVITIILILAGISFPAAQGVLAKAQKSSAENMALQVRSSISAYYTEYRRYPIPRGTASGADVTIVTDENLMDILLGADTANGQQYNPRGISFFAGKKAKGANNGLVMNASGGGRLLDPWGQLFQVTIDTDFNNRVNAESRTGSMEIVPQNVVVWSTGKSGAGGARVDWVTTWD